MNPDDMMQMAEFGKQVYDTLTDDQKQNLLGPPTKSLGRGLASLFDIAFYKPNSWAMKFNHKLEEQAKLLEKETSPMIEKLIENDEYSEDTLPLAVKALESSKYQLNSEILRNYYSKLITSSLTKDVNAKVSPNFSTILSNFSEKDAVFLKRMVTEKDFINGIGFSDIRIEDDNGYGYEPFTYLVVWENNEIEDCSEQIASLLSFGLIREWNMLTATSEKEKYSKVESSHYFTSLKNSVGSVHFRNYTSVKSLKKSILLTELGRSFVASAVPK
ncbi:DUF4393 domain-containing protein [Enterococcus casseliflavus]|uniref:Abi-alpha family protein n=1 Tax=Enterococcus casseliflavus TaxID=37734 RepID=UPI001E4CC593|nr:Abi-alpha family protein [Enterococcus casseliflavus]MCD5192285.1 DUF4393 domain-containing protein [Enterococcus casseliflavus]